MEDILNLAVDYARSLGAAYAEARYHRIEGGNINIRADRVIGITYRASEGIGVRVIYNGALAFASTTRLDAEGIKKAVERAVATARVFSGSIKRKAELSSERLGRSSYEVKPKKSFDSMPQDLKISFLKDLYTIALESLKEARLSSLLTSYSESIEEKMIINSDGAYIRSRLPRIESFINIVLSSPEKGTINKWFEIGAVRGLEHFEEIKLVDSLKETISRMEENLLRGIEPPKEKVDVILGSEVVGLIVHEGVGHPLEADRVLGREAAQAGESYVKPEMVGKARIGNRYATIIDDPTIPGSSGYYLYDDEGVPARPKILYREGVIENLLHNRETARLMGVASNASARATNHASEPIVRMSNTYLAPGDMEFEELIEDIDLGVYIKSNMEWNIDDTRWRHRYIGLEAFLIEKGELTKPVRNPVIEITTGDLLSNIVAADKNLEFFPGMCGKGEPMQGIPVWMGGPNIRLPKISIGVAPIE
ncbi:MAG: TldD/PmbA family protein [Sulfolobales archaeon]